MCGQWWCVFSENVFDFFFSIEKNVRYTRKEYDATKRGMILLSCSDKNNRIVIVVV